jgi:hypothetical protein
MILNLENYKFAKIITNDIEAICLKIEKCMKLLSPFTRYRDVNKLLNALRDTNQRLTAHHRKYEKIVKSKGKVDDKNSKRDNK